MKLTPAAIEIGEFEGFTPEKDIFQRKHFAEQLTNLIGNVNDELVLAIDAPWGEGKTTFVRMWRGMLHDHNMESIYFDAFKNDFLEDPFLALVGEVHHLLDDEEHKEVREEFKRKAIDALKIFGKASLRVGIRAATAGVLDETVLEGAGAEGEVAKISDKYISDRIDSVESDKSILESFRETLGKVVKELGGDAKLVFIVDELDRCKPSFALDLLEKIKHIFSTTGIIFVLVMNRDQMSEVIKSRYGLGIDSTKYLQKFIHIWSGLPKTKEHRTSDGRRYLQDCLSRMDFEIKTKSQQTGIELYEELIDYYNISLREIERSLAYYAIIQNMTEGDLNADYAWVSIYLSIVKVLFPKSYRKMQLDNISYEEAIQETKLDNFEADYWKGDKPEGHPLRWLLKYYLSSDEEAKALLAEGNYLASRSYGRSAVTDICGWLETFKR
jgi:KAP family P-loop domain